MADVNIIPKIRCDNCGHIEEKTPVTDIGTGRVKEYRKPRLWGEAEIGGGRSTDSYGRKERIAFADLCPQCAEAALQAAAQALKDRRGE